jgi:hypothetical protein
VVCTLDRFRCQILNLDTKCIFNPLNWFFFLQITHYLIHKKSFSAHKSKSKNPYIITENATQIELSQSIYWYSRLKIHFMSKFKFCLPNLFRWKIGSKILITYKNISHVQIIFLRCKWNEDVEQKSFSSMSTLMWVNSFLQTQRKSSHSCTSP